MEFIFFFTALSSMQYHTPIWSPQKVSKSPSIWKQKPAQLDAMNNHYLWVLNIYGEQLTTFSGLRKKKKKCKNNKNWVKTIKSFQTSSGRLNVKSRFYSSMYTKKLLKRKCWHSMIVHNHTDKTIVYKNHIPTMRSNWYNAEKNQFSFITTSQVLHTNLIKSNDLSIMHIENSASA